MSHRRCALVFLRDRCMLVLLAAVFCALPSACAADATCGANSGDGSASCSASAGVVAPYDPYAPLPPSAGESASGSAASASPPSSIMHMWTTPLFIARPKLRDVSAFNRALSARAEAAFEHVVGAAAAEALLRGDDAQGVNERFFQWQRDQHARGAKADSAYVALSSSVEFQSLLHMFDSYVVGYLEGIGRDAAWQRAHLRRGALFCWATVASGGNYHLAHTHPEHMVSGVYYSRIPPAAGTIIFDDPRGPRWPFDGRYIHRPQPGEIVLFPSWLTHQVTATPGEERRISWSCNVPGSWEDLADVNLA